MYPSRRLNGGNAASIQITMSETLNQPGSEVIRTCIPARLDRLPWSRWHWLIVTGLGVTWVLDGLEVTLAGTIGGVIKSSLHMSDAQVGDSATFYLIGAVVGALFFGWLTDRLGRKKLFSLTLLVYLTATVACGLSWNFWSFAIFRMLTGAGIGGEYAAVNATIQELIPARRRGFPALVVNGSFWLGAAIGALGAYVVLDPAIMPPEIGWRAAFIIGGVLGLIVLLLRRFLPESPRWLMTHGQPEEAERIVGEIEARVERETGRPLPPVLPGMLRLRTDVRSWFKVGAEALVTTYRRQAWLGVTLMAAQAFCYNAVFFTYALVLTRFYGIASGNVGLFMLPFAIGNFLGPLVLGRLFDTIGRRIMITATYGVSGVLMVLTGWMFTMGWLDAVQQTLAWTGIFFVASAAASSAYLTVGESFPLEVRAVAIALFYALGTGIGGVAGPTLFGALIDTGSRMSIFYGYFLGGALMVIAAVVAGFLAANAERRSLEDVAPPLSAV